MLAGILILLGLSFLVLIHEAGHFFAAKRAGLLVEEFGFGFPPRIASKKIGETVYSLNWLPFGGFVRVHGEKTTEFEGGSSKEVPLIKERAFVYQSVWTRFIVIGAGVAINFLFGWFLLSVVFFVGSPRSVMVTETLALAPGAEAGLLEGDQLIDFTSAQEFISYVNTHRGEEISLRALRGGEEKVVLVVPRTHPPVSEGALGIAVSDMGFERLGFFQSIIQGFTTALHTTGEIFLSLVYLIADLFQTGGALAEGVVGPIGILGVAGQLAGIGYIYLVQLLALISLNLAVLNILPIPALDGGRILFLFIETIKGGPIKRKRELLANAISFGVLFLVMIFITARDIVHLF